MRTVLFIFILSLAVVDDLHAQEGLNVRGTVTDSSGLPLNAATVRLIVAGSNLRVVDTFAGLTRPDGSFHFRLREAKPFTLLVTMKGCGNFQRSFSPAAAIHSLVLSPILLKAAYTDLAPATIVGVRPIWIRKDTVEFYTAAFHVRAGDELEYLLKKFPGLHVNSDGSVAFQGKKIAKIMVNGRDFVGGDVATAIRNLPADIVESIQLIDDYGDKGRLTGVRSAESEKTLNVVLKQDKRNGKFGSLETNTGNKGKYNVTLFSDVFNKDKQLTLNAWSRDVSATGSNDEKGVHFGYSDRWNKKWSGSTGLSLWRDDYSSGNGMAQDNFLPGSITHLQQTNLTTGDDVNGGGGYSLEYRPDPNTLLRVSPSLQLSKSSTAISSDLSSRESDSNFQKNTSGNSTNLMHSQNVSVGADIYFENTDPASGRRFSFTGGAHYSNQRQNGDQRINTTIQTDSMGNVSFDHYLLQNTSLNQDLTAGLNYYLPLGKTAFLELAYAWHYSLIQNDRLTKAPDSITMLPATIDSLSNDYTFHLITHRLHAGYLAHSKKLNLTLSLDAQPASQNGQTANKGDVLSYHYFNMLPLAQLSWSFSAARKLNVEYTGNSLPPQVQQLQPVMDLSNPQYPVTGNPSLKPSYTHAVGLHYEQSAVLPAGLPAFGIDFKYNTTQNTVIPDITHPHDTSAVVQRSTWINTNGFHSFMANYHLDFPYLLHKRLRIAASGSFGTVQAVSLTDGVFYRTNSLNWSQVLNVIVDIPDVIEYRVYGNYTHSITLYTEGGILPASFSSASWELQSRHFLFKKWIFEYAATQLFTSGATQGLQSNPILLNTSIQRQFFPNNRLSCRFSINDLLNSSSNTSQIVTPTSITQTRTTLIGRYFLLAIIWKFEKFRQE
ncbi:MAG: TonB-dependent receptor [Puia sp.]|nr:TonB-dependent receptor [Puia sp.]